MTTAATGTSDHADAAPDGRRWVLLDALGLALLALVVRVPAYLADRSLTFDDGVFANSAIAMREGGVPFREVFSSQGPLFLPMVYVGDLVGLRTLDSPRVLAVVSGIVAVVATYWAALRLTDRAGALLAGGLLAVSGGLAWVTGPLAADGPALAFAALAVGLALRQRDEPGLGRAMLLGAAVGACLSTKSLEAPVLVPVGLVLAAPVLSAARRRTFDRTGVTHLVAAAAAAVAVFLLVTLPLGFAEVWDQSVVYRTDAASDRDIPGTAAKLFSTLWDRDLAMLAMGVVAVGAALFARRNRRDGAPTERSMRERWADYASQQRWSAEGRDWSPSDRLLVESWLVVTLVWLAAVVSPLWRPHVAAVAIPLALTLGLHRPPTRILRVAVVAVAPLVVLQLDGLLVPGPYRGEQAELVAALRNLPDGAWVLSDEPGVVWRSGLRTTDDLVDPSMLRRAQGRYTEDSLVRDAADPRICAVVATSDQHFRYFPGLPSRLEELGFFAASDVGDGETLYVRASCDPSG